MTSINPSSNYTNYTTDFTQTQADTTDFTQTQAAAAFNGNYSSISHELQSLITHFGMSFILPLWETLSKSLYNQLDNHYTISYHPWSV
jgi:hypothetical protein